MSSLTFSRPPPLAPSVAPRSQAPLSPGSATTVDADIPTPPLSPTPLGSLTTLSQAHTKIAAPAAQHPGTGPTRITQGSRDMHMPNLNKRQPGDTPFNTPEAGVRTGGRLPLIANTLTEATRGNQTSLGVPSSLSTPLGGTPMRPLNAAAAMRGRAIGIGGGGSRPSHESGGGGAPTPGNTPSSLERISRRLANNLMLAPQAQAPSNRIAPSYEFDAGLTDLNRRLATQPEYTPCSPQSTLGPRHVPDLFASGKADWQSHYAESEPDIAEKEEENDKGRSGQNA